MAVTAQDIITRALRKVGAIDAIETPTAEEMSDALGSLNDILGEWSITRGLILAQTKADLPLVAGQQLYSLPGDLAVTRPVRIESAYLVNADRPVDIQPIEYFQPNQTDQGRPERAYVRYGNTVELSLYPVPGTADKLRMLLWQSIDEITDAYADLDMPRYLATYLRVCLQIDLAPDYGRQVDPIWVMKQQDLRQQISSVHGRRQRAVFDSGLIGRRSYVRGEDA